MFIKKYYGLFLTVFLSGAATLVLSFFSCKKEAIGQPEIKRVRITDPTKKDSSLTAALPGSIIVIEGKGLSNAQQIFFNNFPAEFNPAYNTDTHIIVQVPSETPTVADDPNVPNTIKVITDRGTATYQFDILLPPPVISFEGNNFNPAPGESITIKGKFLNGVSEVIFPGGNKGLNLSVNEDGTELTITVPGMDDKDVGYLKLNSPFGNVETKNLFNHISGDGVFINFDENPKTYIWGFSVGNDNTGFQGNRKKFARNKRGAVGPWNAAWWANDGLITWKDNSHKVVSADQLSMPASKYVFRFEVYTNYPLDGGFIRMMWKVNGGSTNTFYEWHPAKSGDFDTKKKWVTVSIPLNEFFTLDNGMTWDLDIHSFKKTKISSVGDILNVDGTAGEVQWWFLTLDKGATNWDTGIDNVRIERLP